MGVIINNVVSGKLGARIFYLQHNVIINLYLGDVINERITNDWYCYLSSR
jgi:hypothetical protein